MRSYWIALLAALLVGCSTTGTLSAEENINIDAGQEEMNAVVFYGVVTDEATGKVIPGATVEVYCESCEWHEINTTDEYGVYAFKGTSHIGHSGSMMAGTSWPGYNGRLFVFEDLPEYSNRVDFSLQPN